MSVLDELRKFLTQASFVTMATGIVVGVAIGTVVGALVADLVNPIIGVFFHANFSDVGKFTINGSQFQFGAFLSAAINFIVVMVVIFFVLVYPTGKIQARRDAKAAKAAPKKRPCPECYSEIDARASRCAFCASAVPKAST